MEERMVNMDKEQEVKRKDLSKIDSDIDHYLSMAKDATSDAVRKRYEKSADDLIKHQQLLEQELVQKPRDKYEVGTALDTVLSFIKSPYLTWENEDLHGKRMILKLVFDDYLKYSKKEGVGTAKISEIISIFKVLEKPPEDGSHYVDTHVGLTKQLKDYLVGFWNYYQNNESIQKVLI